MANTNERQPGPARGEDKFRGKDRFPSQAMNCGVIAIVSQRLSHDDKFLKA